MAEPLRAATLRDPVAPIPGRGIGGLIPVDGRPVHIRRASQARIFSP